MAEVTLKRERPSLTVNVGDERYEVPLTFNHREMEKLGKAKDGGAAVSSFFAEYLGDVVDMLGDDDLSALFQAWGAARAEIGEPDLGEPQASPKR